MDGQRFDALTRRLATGTSRRTVLRGALAGLGAALLGRATARAEEACPVALDLGEPCLTKVGICHRTGSETNPYRYINVCVDAAPAHATHGDLVACPLPTQVIDPETCTCICEPTLECYGGQVLNEATCECECPAELPVLCNGQCVSGVCDAGETFNPVTCQCEPSQTCLGVLGDCGGPGGPDPNRPCCEPLFCRLIPVGDQGAGYFCVPEEDCYIEGFDLICPS